VAHRSSSGILTKPTTPRASGRQRQETANGPVTRASQEGEVLEATKSAPDAIALEAHSSPLAKEYTSTAGGGDAAGKSGLQHHSQRDKAALGHPADDDSHVREQMLALCKAVLQDDSSASSAKQRAASLLDRLGCIS
jgi:hypothetical protein